MKKTFVKLSKSLIVDYSQILFCKSSNNYTELHFRDGNVKLVTITLKIVEDLLPEYCFFRASKSIIINLDTISCIENCAKRVVLETGVVLKVSIHRSSLLLGKIEKETVLS